MSWKEWVLALFVVSLILLWVVVLMGSLHPLEEVCDEYCGSYMDLCAQPASGAYSNRLCPHCGKRWASSDVLGWGWMARRLERALR